jgi:ABC-2 type transport system permease protein
MKEISVLLSPVFWSVKNDLVRFNRSFYRKVFFYLGLGAVFITLIAKLLGMGMTRLQSLSPDVFQILIMKGYSLIFAIIFFVQIINGFAISLTTYYQSRDLEVLLTSPVNRTSLFLSKLFETHVKASWMLIVFGIPLLVSSGLIYHAGMFYYPYALVLFAVFSVIPVNIGTGLTIFLSGFFHVKKMKRVLFSSGIVAAVLLVTLLRIFRPERFVNPELFANLTLFVSELKTPAFILLPNRWLSESVFDFLGKGRGGDTLIFLSLLFLTAYVTTLLLHQIFRRYHARGWGQLQEGSALLKGGRAHIPSALSMKLLRWPGKILGQKSGTLVIKDLLCQIRDAGNIHQLLILLSLITIYLFSVASLPLNWEGYSVQLKYLISFFNLGLILIIIASLCSRILYPAVIADGASLWILRSAPLTPGRYVWTKLLFFCVPLLILGLFLALFSSFLIGIGRGLIVLKITTTVLVTFSLAGLAIAFGISDIGKVTGSPQERSRTGSTPYMLVSVFLVLFTLALEIIPTFLYFLKEAQKAALTQKAWILVGGVVLVVFLVNFLVALFALRLSVRRFERLEPG